MEGREDDGWTEEGKGVDGEEGEVDDKVYEILRVYIFTVLP